MKLTTNPKRIEDAHYALQRLEDEVVGCMVPVDKASVGEMEQVYNNRLEHIHNEVCKVIRLLNEAYD